MTSALIQGHHLTALCHHRPHGNRIKKIDVKQGLSIRVEGEKVSKHLLAFNCSLCRKEEA